MYVTVCLKNCNLLLGKEEVVVAFSSSLMRKWMVAVGGKLSGNVLTSGWAAAAE